MKSNPSEQRINKVKKFWTSDAIKNQQYSISIPSMLKYLSQWYPELAADNQFTDLFVKSFNVEDETAIDVKWLESKHFECGRKVIVVNIPMGGGKTTATLKYLEENNKKSFVWLAPRQTLVSNTYTRMNGEFNIQCVSHLKVGSDKSKLRKANRLIICNQSLHHLEDETKYDIVVIDEIETVLLSWLEEDTHGKNMCENFKRFCNIIKNARKVILLDAFTTTKTFKLMYSLGYTKSDIQVYKGGNTPAHRTIFINQDLESIMKKIVDATMRGEKSFVFYPYKKGTQKTHYGIVQFDEKIKEAIKAVKLSKAKTTEEKLAIHEKKTYAKSILYYAESRMIGKGRVRYVLARPCGFLSCSFNIA
jgi:hypothetical protein